MEGNAKYDEVENNIKQQNGSPPNGVLSFEISIEFNKSTIKQERCYQHSLCEQTEFEFFFCVYNNKNNDLKEVSGQKDTAAKLDGEGLGIKFSHGQGKQYEPDLGKPNLEPMEVLTAVS